MVFGRMLNNNKLYFILCAILLITLGFNLFPKIQKKSDYIFQNQEFNIFDEDVEVINLKIKNINREISNFQFPRKTLFDRGHEAEELYDLLSNYAIDYKLILENISKGKIKKYYKSDIFPGKDKESNQNKDRILFSEILVEYSIVGSYENYMAFRKKLSVDRAILNIKSEEIMVSAIKNSKLIKVRLALITYRLGELDYGEM